MSEVNDWNAKVIAEFRAHGGKVGGRATIVEGEERDRLYAAQAKRFSAFGDYEKKTTRKIPVIALERID